MNPTFTPVERLKAIGFRKCGEWRIEDGKLKCLFSEDPKAPNVLYAFVSSDAVLYVGKTINSLKKRMYGYQNPGPTQSTNNKGNRLIKEMLKKNSLVDIYSLPDNGLLYYGGFHVNLAAGLEDSMINELNPKWNKGSNNILKDNLDSN